MTENKTSECSEFVVSSVRIGFLSACRVEGRYFLLLFFLFSLGGILCVLLICVREKVLRHGKYTYLLSFP